MHHPDPSSPDFFQRSERYWFLGTVLTSIDYGINITLFAMCTSFLYRHIRKERKDRGQYRWGIFSLCFTIVMFGFATLSMTLETKVAERAFVEFRDLPGGPSSYLHNMVFGRITTLRAGYVTLVLCHYCAMGLLMWRCLVIYRSSTGYISLCGHRIPVWTMVMIFPLSLFAASFATGTFFILQVLAPSSLSRAFASAFWIVIWGVFAMALSWTLTGLIVVRILIILRETRKVLGNDRHSLDYTSIVTMLVESAIMASSFALYFIVAFLVKSPSLVMAPFLVTQIQVTSHLLMIYQITKRKAISKDARTPAELNFVDAVVDSGG